MDGQLRSDVLLVEDTFSMARIFQEYLRRGPYNVRHCDTGRTAIKEISRDPPDVVLLDLRLHGRPLLSLYRGALLCRLCRPLLLDLRLHGCPLLSLLGLHRALLGGSLLRGLRLHGRSLLGCLSRALLLGLKRASLLRTLLGGPLRRSLPRILHCRIPRSLNRSRCGHPRTSRGRTRS